MQSKYIFLILAVIFNVAANFILKAFVANNHPDFISQLKMVPFYLALSCFGINFLFYAKALQGIQLSLAYPLMVGFSVVGLLVLLMIFLHEQITFVQGAGILLVIAGVVLISK